MNLPLQAEIKRQELLFGCLTVTEVVQWADSVLTELDEYDDDLANISLAGHACPQDVVGLLSPLAAGADDFEPMRSVLGSLHRVLQKDDSQVRTFTRALERFWIDHDYELPEDMQFINGLDDIFGLAEDGIYGTREEELATLLGNLARFDETANKTLGHVL